jgi:predicted transcriptional regulator
MSDLPPLTEAELVELERQALEAAVAEARASAAAGRLIPHEEIHRDTVAFVRRMDERIRADAAKRRRLAGE